MKQKGSTYHSDDKYKGFRPTMTLPPVHKRNEHKKDNG